MYNIFTPTAPLGGYKDSWYGRDLGKEALLGNTQEHQEYYRAIPSISMPSPPLNLRLAPEQFAYVINHAQDKVIIDSTPLPLLAQGGESFGFPPLWWRPARLPVRWQGPWIIEGHVHSGTSLRRWTHREGRRAHRLTLRGARFGTPGPHQALKTHAVTQVTRAALSESQLPMNEESNERRRSAMKTKAAVLWGLGEKWEVEELDLDDPKAGEVMVKMTAAGLCHSDEHLVTGDIPIPFPVVGGHEGAGVIHKVGPGVTEVEEGDPVVLSFLPACGRCSYCAKGMTNLCDLGGSIILGPQIDGTYRFHGRGEDIGQMCVLGTFSEYTVVPIASVVKIDQGFPLDKAALVGCGVTTGFGSAVRTAELRAGDAAVVMGVGGIGINAVQGARIAGCRYIIAIDPVPFKREKALEFGATHAFASVDEAWPVVSELTRGQLADACIITTDVAEGEYVLPALSLVGKGGRVVITAIGHPEEQTISASLFELTLYEKSIRGSLFGSSNPQMDIPRLLELYNLGQLKLDELITKEYRLEDINEGYDDMRQGRNIRGLIRY